VKTAIDAWATQGEPFFFVTDFMGERIEAYPLHALESSNISFDFSNKSTSPLRYTLEKSPLNFASYSAKIERIQEHIRAGDTYVLNFTQPTPIRVDASLREIYTQANAPFKLYYQDKFVCFSPEPFITIEGNTITTYPMKGTIDATLPQALQTILDDPKEMAEHVMIIDLLRNDLAMVAHDVRVEQFRYAQTIQAGDKNLIQISSKISATLPQEWKSNLDTILRRLLPAGSISGAPKKSTTHLIQTIEEYERGFYSGIMGYFDGERLTTAVMIRFIESTPDGLVYKSGGGITLESDAAKEYQEMLDKVYIP